MSDSQWLGMLCVLGAGVFQGSFMLPMKRTEHWAFENVWLVFACTAYLVCPWVLVLGMVPQVLKVYGSVSFGLLGTVFGFGVGWGIGALTFGLGVASVGVALALR